MEMGVYHTIKERVYFHVVILSFGSPGASVYLDISVHHGIVTVSRSGRVIQLQLRQCIIRPRASANQVSYKRSLVYGACNAEKVESRS
jgi:hypothetical protein